MKMETTKRKRRRRLIEGFLLAPEIITEILSRLPADSAVGCRCICKQWRSLIDHPSFRDTHTRQLILSSTSSASSFGHFLYASKRENKFHLQFVEYNDTVDDEFKPGKPIISDITDPHFPFLYDKWGTLMISSCNGLVFMGSTKPNYINDMFVCNPFTKEYMNLSTAYTDSTDDQDHLRIQLECKGFMAYGFGYLASTNEYKVVGIYYNEDLDDEGKVYVYTLGTGRWRKVEETPYWLYNEHHPGFFAHGAIHWFCYHHTYPKKIVSFDLADEEFRLVILPLPPPPPSANYVDRLGVFGGCLCVTRSVIKLTIINSQ